MLDVSDYKAEVVKSIDDIHKLKESIMSKDKPNIDILSDLDTKEKQLRMMSGMENFQPNLNMFGSNVFSSIQTDINAIKESVNNEYKTIDSQSQGLRKQNSDLEEILTA